MFSPSGAAAGWLGARHVYDVFASSSRRSSVVTYLGSIEAPGLALGQVYARKVFGRRGGYGSMWLVHRDGARRGATSRVCLERGT